MTYFIRSLFFWGIILTLTLSGCLFYFLQSNNTFTISFEPRLNIPQLFSAHDENRNGINDTQDLLNGAREEVRNQPQYQSAYYQGGYPPDTEGVCSDVIWRAFKHAGYDLKSLVDKDIKQRTKAYSRVDNKPDPNIDFRRVPNLDEFFKKHALALTTEVKPGDIQNLQQWQGGDIVIFGAPHPHIAFLSDKRRSDGVPLIIHNSGPSPREEDALLYWHNHLSPIIGHYRWPKTANLSSNTANPR